MIIVLSPYSNNKQGNYIKVLEYVIKLTKEGEQAFSPILYGHMISIIGDIKGDHETWSWLNEIFELATEFHILRLDGWQRSKGLDKEIKLIKKYYKDIPVRWINQ